MTLYIIGATTGGETFHPYSPPRFSTKMYIDSNKYSNVITYVSYHVRLCKKTFQLIVYNIIVVPNIISIQPNIILIQMM